MNHESYAPTLGRDELQGLGVDREDQEGKQEEKHWGSHLELAGVIRENRKHFLQLLGGGG